MKLVLYENSGVYLKEIIISHLHNLEDNSKLSGSVIVLVGPEGGWSEREIEDITSNGYMAVNLGNNVLRTETAAISSLAIISHFWNS